MTAAALVAATALALAPTLPLGFTADDGALVAFSARHGAAEILLDPATLRAGSSANLTPLMHLFYSLNLSLWGLDARGFRAAQVALAVASALTYHALLRRFARPAFALLGSLALVASLPFFYVSSSLMTNHYVAGLAFSCAALLAYARELERRRWGASVASAALYALAALSKEVYLPAIAVFALMAGRDRDAWRRLGAAP